MVLPRGPHQTSRPGLACPTTWFGCWVRRETVFASDADMRRQHLGNVRPVVQGCGATLPAPPPGLLSPSVPPAPPPAGLALASRPGGLEQPVRAPGLRPDLRVGRPYRAGRGPAHIPGVTRDRPPIPVASDPAPTGARGPGDKAAEPGALGCRPPAAPGAWACSLLDSHLKAEAPRAPLRKPALGPAACSRGKASAQRDEELKLLLPTPAVCCAPDDRPFTHVLPFNPINSPGQVGSFIFAFTDEETSSGELNK